MKRWVSGSYPPKMSESAKIDEFLSDVLDVCVKHKLSISHEDTHGAFIVENFSRINLDSLLDAQDGTKKETQIENS